MQHTFLKSIVAKQRNSNVTFAVCVRDVKLPALMDITHIYFECIGMAEYECIRPFE